MIVNCFSESVLVHCIAGVSRSVCIVAAYLIAACDMSYVAALAYIVSKRPCANPNFGFRMQLAKYAGKVSYLHFYLHRKYMKYNLLIVNYSQRKYICRGAR